MITKILAVALVMSALAAAGFLKLYVGASKAQAVAEQANDLYVAQIESQEEQKEELKAAHMRDINARDAAAAAMTEWRESLITEVRIARDNTEGAAALMSDDDWWCASEPVPKLLLGSLYEQVPGLTDN